ncbi:hypothetical protein [Neobacillus niacini]|uniref:hypothetical protein n=1 Tax=Neobacillus niacini TaxID=86668 RepID=UPI0021CB156C|nr:hypothetical protein [Neobacillus niacini]MCM3766826.1 hypothetical protein [Neobacillus niacini]
MASVVLAFWTSLIDRDVGFSLFSVVLDRSYRPGHRIFLGFGRFGPLLSTGTSNFPWLRSFWNALIDRDIGFSLASVVLDLSYRPGRPIFLGFGRFGTLLSTGTSNFSWLRSFWNALIDRDVGFSLASVVLDLSYRPGRPIFLGLGRFGPLLSTGTSNFPWLRSFWNSLIDRDVGFSLASVVLDRSYRPGHPIFLGFGRFANFLIDRDIGFPMASVVYRSLF